MRKTSSGKCTAGLGERPRVRMGGRTHAARRHATNGCYSSDLPVRSFGPAGGNLHVVFCDVAQSYHFMGSALCNVAQSGKEYGQMSHRRGKHWMCRRIWRGCVISALGCTETTEI